MIDLALRPDPSRCAPGHRPYLDRVPAGDLLTHLEDQLEAFVALLGDRDEALGSLRYAEDKWSVRQVLGHVMDAERIFTYRLLCIARGETQALPGFDEAAYAAAGGFDDRPLEALLDEFGALRSHTLAFLQGLPESALAREGTANGRTVSGALLACLIHGHAQHHLEVLRTRYLGAGSQPLG